MMELELKALEFMWKREEELARIIDEELTPRRLLEAHLRRLPITLRQPLRSASISRKSESDGGLTIPASSHSLP